MKFSTCTIALFGSTIRKYATAFTRTGTLSLVMISCGGMLSVIVRRSTRTIRSTTGIRMKRPGPFGSGSRRPRRNTIPRSYSRATLIADVRKRTSRNATAARMTRAAVTDWILWHRAGPGTSSESGAAGRPCADAVARAARAAARFARPRGDRGRRCVPAVDLALEPAWVYPRRGLARVRRVFDLAEPARPGRRAPAALPPVVRRLQEPDLRLPARRRLPRHRPEPDGRARSRRGGRARRRAPARVDRVSPLARPGRRGRGARARGDDAVAVRARARRLRGDARAV